MDFSALQTCACMGPQDGEPVCPCRMNDVTVVEGRYIDSNGKDLGPYVFINKSRVEKIETKDLCWDFNHNPHPETIQAHLETLKDDQVYIHVCRTCNAEYKIMPTQRMLLEDIFRAEEEGILILKGA